MPIERGFSDCPDVWAVRIILFVLFNVVERSFCMRVILSGGGTGGHINPALSIAGYIRNIEKDSDILFVGTKRGLESTLVPKENFPIKYVDVEGLKTSLSFKNIKSLMKFAKAISKCKKIIKDFKPDIVIGTGGYVCAPVVYAANKLGIPTIIHEQNVFPGSAIKFLSKKSSVTAISFDESRKYLKDAKEILTVGNPIRPAILEVDRNTSRDKLGLGDEKFIVVFGGSLGAKKINDVVAEYLASLNDDNIKVCFATGERDYDRVMEKLGASISQNIDVRKYIHNMDEVLSAADLVICRSGAMTVSELCVLGRPSILIPSPNVTHNHQEYNARALSDIGAARIILEKDFDTDTLKREIENCFESEISLSAMSEKADSLKMTDASDMIYIKAKELIAKK